MSGTIRHGHKRLKRMYCYDEDGQKIDITAVYVEFDCGDGGAQEIEIAVSTLFGQDTVLSLYSYSKRGQFEERATKIFNPVIMSPNFYALEPGDEIKPAGP